MPASHNPALVSRTLDPFRRRQMLLERLCVNRGLEWAIVYLAPNDRTGLDRQPQVTATFGLPKAPTGILEAGVAARTSGGCRVIDVLGSRIVDAPDQGFEAIQDDIIAHVLVPPLTPTHICEDISVRLGEEIASSRFERILECVSFAQIVIDSRFENSKEELDRIAKFLAQYTRSSSVLICNTKDQAVRVRGSYGVDHTALILSRLSAAMGQVYDLKRPATLEIPGSQAEGQPLSVMIIPILVPGYDPDGDRLLVVDHVVICTFVQSAGGRLYYSDCDRRVVEVVAKELSTGIAEARHRQSVEQINHQFANRATFLGSPAQEIDVEEMRLHIRILVDNIHDVELLTDTGIRFPRSQPVYVGEGHTRAIVFPFLASVSGAYAVKLGLASRKYISQYKVRIIENYLSHYRVAEASRALYDDQVTLAAQIRHAIKAPLAAAQEYLGILVERSHIYARQPTVFQRLMLTPTMSGAAANAMLFISQAISFAESARSLVRPLESSDIRWADYYLSEILTETEMMFRPSAQARRLRVQYAFDPDFEKYQLSGERSLVAIVIHNLVDNAIKFAVSGKSVLISAQLVDNKSRWRLEVTDDGVAIPETDREKIFDAWQRSEHTTVTNRRPGTGLGLAICRDIVNAMDPTGICDLDQEMLDKERGLARKTFFIELAVNGRMKAEYERQENSL